MGPKLSWSKVSEVLSSISSVLSSVTLPHDNIKSGWLYRLQLDTQTTHAAAAAKRIQAIHAPSAQENATQMHYRLGHPSALTLDGALKRRAKIHLAEKGKKVAANTIHLFTLLFSVIAIPKERRSRRSTTLVMNSR